MKAKGLILAGDIGGTKSQMGLFRLQRGQLVSVKEKGFANKAYGRIDDIIGEFLEGEKGKNIQGACLGVAAPIGKNRAVLTNINWTIDCRELKKRFSLLDVILINDLVATAWGLGMLKKDDMFTLRKRPKRRGNLAIIAPGTGLGEAIVFYNGTSYHASASEGGHADFAPTDAVEIGLLMYLMERFGHTSYERVASGIGIKNIYDFLTKDRVVPSRIKNRFEKEDPAAVIAQEGEAAGGDEICREALDIFVSALAREAGNLALKALATGGVYIGGGIAPKIIKTLKKKGFLKAFADKGRFRGFLEDIPIYVILNPKTALLGAANYARGKILNEGLKIG